MIYLVRHGQTKFNPERRRHGHLDSPLTELGHEQARRAGEVLAGLIDPRGGVIFSSPLGRALQTARIMGSAEGMTQAEMENRGPMAEATSVSETMSLQSPDGENLEALAKRLDRAWRRVVEHHAGSRIVVSHGVAGRVLRALQLGLNNVEALRLEAPQDVQGAGSPVIASSTPTFRADPP